MAITGTDAKINDSNRQAMTGFSVTGTGSNATNPSQWDQFLGLDFVTAEGTAGIATGMASAISDSLEEYKKNIRTAINPLGDALANDAFQGTEVASEVKNFAWSVEKVALSFIEKIEAAQRQIAQSVEEVYTAQDTHLGGGLSGDASRLDPEVQGPPAP